MRCPAGEIPAPRGESASRSSCGSSRCGEAADVTLLPGCLDRLRVVVLPDEGHCLLRRHAVQYGNAGQRSAGPPMSTGTRNLHPLRLGATPCLAQGVLRVVAIGGQSEVRPADPAGVPGNQGWSLIEQVEAKLRERAVRRWQPQTTPANESPGREAQHPGSRHIPEATHDRKLPAAHVPQADPLQDRHGARSGKRHAGLVSRAGIRCQLVGLVRVHTMGWKVWKVSVPSEVVLGKSLGYACVVVLKLGL